MTPVISDQFLTAGKAAAGGTWGAIARQFRRPTLSGMGGAAKFLGEQAVPAGLGAATGYGAWHASVPEDATTSQKVEGAIAAALAGIGGQGFGRANTWRNAATAARRANAAGLAKGYASDFGGHLTKQIGSKVVMPKIKYLGMATAPVALSNIQGGLSNVNRFTSNLADTSGTAKEIAEVAAAKDPAGKSIAQKVKDAIGSVTDDIAHVGSNARRVSNTLDKGTFDITRAVRDAVRGVGGNLTDTSKTIADSTTAIGGTLTDATKDITSSLAGASDSFAGAAGGINDLTKTIKPVADELVKKDESGATVFGNLNRLLSGASDGLNDLRNAARTNLNKFDSLSGIAEYAPYLAGAGLTAGGLYGLYRALRGAKRQTREQEDV